MIKIISVSFAAIWLIGNTAWAQVSDADTDWNEEEAVASFNACFDSAYETESLQLCGYWEECMIYSRGGTTTMGMMECFRAEENLWDIKLNKEYKILMAAAKSKDKNMPDAFKWDGSSRAASLLKAQRAWIAYRDAECEDAYWSAHPGSIKQIHGSSCKQHLVKERTIKLRVENEDRERR